MDQIWKPIVEWFPHAFFAVNEQFFFSLSFESWSLLAQLDLVLQSFDFLIILAL